MHIATVTFSGWFMYIWSHNYRVCPCQMSQENKATNTGPHIIIPIYSVLAWKRSPYFDERSNILGHNFRSVRHTPFI